MSEMSGQPVGNLDPVRAVELGLLVDLEAGWENLRKHPSRSTESGPAAKDLPGIQKAYDAFRGKLVAYNKRYAPAHVPEMLLNTPYRLGSWCQAMRDLYARVEHDPRGRCPVHLLEKAYRWADQMAERMKKGHLNRSVPPGTIRDVIEGLEALVRWCDGLACVAKGRQGSISPEEATNDLPA